MAVQFAKCLNRGGCSLAYTGEVIQYEGEARCPECGQALSPAKRPRKSRPWVPGLVVIACLLLGTIAFLVWQRRSQPEGPAHAAGPLAPPEAQENRGPAIIEGNSTKLPPELAPAVSTAPAPTPSPATGTPPVIVNEAAADAPEGGAGTPGPGEGVVTKPAALSAQQVDTTRSDVLKRIGVMPRLSVAEKDRLSQKVESAHAMERLRLVHFDRGKSTLSKVSADELIKSFGAGETRDKLADPTLVLVVAGYADSGGDPAANFRISEDRAESVAKLLRGRGGVLNVIHTVAMGSTDLLDGKRPEQNRAVEIWAVVP